VCSSKQSRVTARRLEVKEFVGERGIGSTIALARLMAKLHDSRVAQRVMPPVAR
jgi:hypothetical protein